MTQNAYLAELVGINGGSARLTREIVNALSPVRKRQGVYEWLGPTTLSVVHIGQVATMGS